MKEVSNMIALSRADLRRFRLVTRRCVVPGQPRDQSLPIRLSSKCCTVKLTASDGKQALIQGGFTFPFTEDLLVPAIPVFGGKELCNEGAVSVGVTGDWLYLVIGPWRFWLAIDREGRFPDVVAAIPKATGTRIAFDESDAGAVIVALPRLPNEDE